MGPGSRRRLANSKPLRARQETGKKTGAGVRGSQWGRLWLRGDQMPSLWVRPFLSFSHSCCPVRPPWPSQFSSNFYREAKNPDLLGNAQTIEMMVQATVSTSGGQRGCLHCLLLLYYADIAPLVSCSVSRVLEHTKVRRKRTSKAGCSLSAWTRFLER